METAEHRLKRLYMRSIRRGIKEMDLILGNFAKDHLSALQSAELDAYEALLEEADQDLYLWVTGQKSPPKTHKAMISMIAHKSSFGLN